MLEYKFNSKIAVIMSVYASDNEEKFRRSVESILNQTYKVDLFIFRDGPVKPGIDSLLLELTDRNIAFVVYSQENRGLAVGLNTLIDLIVAEKCYKFIARMDSDDFSYQERMIEQVIFLTNNSSVDVCGTYCREYGATYAIPEKKLPKSHDELVSFSVTRCPFIHPTVMFRVEVFESGFRYPENTEFTEDMALWFLLLNNGVRFANIDKVLLDFYLDENTIYRRKGLKKASSEVKLRLINMFSLRKFSIKNTFLICSRLFFHLSPAWFVKILYKNMR